MQRVYDLSRYISVHQSTYQMALFEISRGRKTSHWMWYIFPQLKGPGRSSMSEYYGIENLDEAKAFLNDVYLGANLREISNMLLQLECSSAEETFGRMDAIKLKSSMTLFKYASDDNKIFKMVLKKYYDGRVDHHRLRK